ncbi:MAG TPA: hypothetical protein VIU41_00075 [Geobacteraceae bacterium]
MDQSPGPLPPTLRDVIRQNASLNRLVTTLDKGILLDLDTPQEYGAALAGAAGQPAPGTVD